MVIGLNNSAVEYYVVFFFVQLILLSFNMR